MCVCVCVCVSLVRAQTELATISDVSARANRLVELNVQEQVLNVFKTCKAHTLTPTTHAHTHIHTHTRARARTAAHTNTTTAAAAAKHIYTHTLSHIDFRYVSVVSTR